MTGDYLSTGDLRKILEQLLSNEVRALLKPAGFTKSGRTFRRVRGPLYDMINFQASVHNGVTTEHSFFVNVGIGSTEVDTVHLNWPDRSGPYREYILDRRWGQLVPHLPAYARFDAATDLKLFADLVVDGLDRVLTVLDGIDTTAALMRWAIEHNWLHNMEKTCAYLTAVEDVGSLRRYISDLRARFADDNRWPSFNRKLVQVCGRWVPALIEGGLLDAAEHG